MSTQEYFGNPDNCRKEYAKIRELISKKNTTDEQWETLTRTAALMMLNCPEEFRTSMEGLCREITTRFVYRQTSVPS